VKLTHFEERDDLSRHAFVQIPRDSKASMGSVARGHSVAGKEAVIAGWWGERAFRVKPSFDHEKCATDAVQQSFKP
jgi:hypothetical protein